MTNRYDIGTFWLEMKKYDIQKQTDHADGLGPACGDENASKRNTTGKLDTDICSFHFRDKHFRASEPTNVYKSDSNQIVDGAILQSYMNLLFAVDWFYCFEIL